jgi:hypothetical protein
MMFRRWLPRLVAGLLGVALWMGLAAPAQAQDPATWNRFFHYPYYYFPHNYWPNMGPKWPEPVGAPYMRPPAYMAYPPFKEINWRYHLWEQHRYYRGFHFWLDQF